RRRWRRRREQKKKPRHHQHRCLRHPPPRQHLSLVPRLSQLAPCPPMETARRRRGGKRELKMRFFRGVICKTVTCLTGSQTLCNHTLVIIKYIKWIHGIA
uniref:Uncharacterized protein n=1 Tax=Oryza brachyantha TaxID=4533 RepID=J3N9Z3_ORYBR